MQTPGDWNQRTRPRQIYPVDTTGKNDRLTFLLEVRIGTARLARVYVARLSNKTAITGRTCSTHQLVSGYGFLELAVICAPDFDEFIGSCNNKHTRKKKNTFRGQLAFTAAASGGVTRQEWILSFFNICIGSWREIPNILCFQLLFIWLIDFSCIYTTGNEVVRGLWLLKQAGLLGSNKSTQESSRLSNQ